MNEADDLAARGVDLARQGRPVEAIALFNQALVLRPEHAPTLANFGTALAASGKPDDAILACRQALVLRPDYLPAHLTLCNALQAQEAHEQSIAALRRLLALRPDLAEAHCALGVALYATGDASGAGDSYHAALKLRPDYPEAQFNLALALNHQGKRSEALVCLGQAISLRPDYAQAHAERGYVLTLLDRPWEAVPHFERAISIGPASAVVVNNLAAAYQSMGEVAKAIECYRRAEALAPGDAATASNRVYAMLFDPDENAQTLRRELAVWCRRHADHLQQSPPRHESRRDPNRRLRVGYVSGDLRAHVVGWNMLPLLANHDHDQFEICCYSNSSAADGITAALRHCCDRWRNIAGITDEQAAELIRGDRIDILIDLSLHSAHNRLLVFARRPAPVQVTYLGYPGTTGLHAIDYRFSDPYLDPPLTDLSIYSEETVRLPHSFWCYQPGGPAPDVAPARAGDNGYVTFGCLNAFAKASSSALTLWAQVLAAIADSRLVLRCPQGLHRQAILERFATRGIATHRIEFVGYQPWAGYIQTFHRIDVSLDPTPYGGGITTCDSLWMGAPVISLSGGTAVGRGGRSILSNIGLPELVATTGDEYVELACNWTKWIQLRPTLRERMSKSPLMNAKMFARDVQAAYRGMWQRACAASPRP